MTNTHFAPPYFWAIMGEIVIYNAAVLVMFSYLKRRHPQTWVAMGSPSFLNNSIKNNFQFLGFMFGRKYLALKDAKLNRLCICIWALAALFPLMWVAGGIFGLLPAQP